MKKKNINRNGINIIKKNISNELGICLNKKKNAFLNKGIPKGITCVGEYKKEV